MIEEISATCKIQLINDKEFFPIGFFLACHRGKKDIAEMLMKKSNELKIVV